MRQPWISRRSSIFRRGPGLAGSQDRGRGGDGPPRPAELSRGSGISSQRLAAPHFRRLPAPLVTRITPEKLDRAGPGAIYAPARRALRPNRAVGSSRALFPDSPTDLQEAT